MISICNYNNFLWFLSSNILTSLQFSYSSRLLLFSLKYFFFFLLSTFCLLLVTITWESQIWIFFYIQLFFVPLLLITFISFLFIFWVSRFRIHLFVYLYKNVYAYVHDKWIIFLLQCDCELFFFFLLVLKLAWIVFFFCWRDWEDIFWWFFLVASEKFVTIGI